MGSISRQSRSERFVETFGERLPKELLADHTWRMEGFILVYQDDELVHHGRMFRCVETDETAFAPTGVVFDPECTEAADVAEFFNLSVEETEALFEKADL